MELTHLIKENPKLVLSLLVAFFILGALVVGRLQRWDRVRLMREEEILKRRIQRELDAEGK